jgi:cytochrome c biogenesis protein CcmG/thiol:disulfide interchange protein DsbE
MKKFSNFLPLTILLALIILASLAIYNSSTKQNISKQELTNGLNSALLETPIELTEFLLPNLFEDEKTLSLTSLKNDENRYSVINFFASWCATCLNEHEYLMKLKNEKSINFYGVSWHDFKDKKIYFLDKNGNPFHEVFADSQGIFTEILGIKSVPETIVVDASGHVVARFLGNINEDIIYEILEFTKKK